MMRQEYKLQGRQQKIGREEGREARPPELTKPSSYTPGHWKSYIPHEISLSSEKRATRTPSYYTAKGEPHYTKPDPNYTKPEPHYDAHEDDSRIRSILTSRKEEERRRQETAMRKVRELQEKVLPLVKGGREEEGAWIGWQSRMEQKLLRLEGQAENMKKEMELELERRIVELENKWEAKLTDYLKALEERS